MRLEDEIRNELNKRKETEKEKAEEAIYKGTEKEA